MSALRKPIPEEDFLETQTGQEWLDESVEDLLSRRDIEAPNATGRNKVLVNADHLPEALADHMATQPDLDHCSEKILIELVGREDDSLLHRWAVSAVGGELSRLRQEKDVREKKDRDDQIAREAAERATREADEKATMI